MNTDINNGRGGAAWRYQCKRCAHEVDLLAAFPETCPECHAAGWWGKLTAKERCDTKPPMSEHGNELCHPSTDAVMGESAQNKGTPGLPHGVKRGRGRPTMPIPDGMIRELVARRFGAKRIAQELEAKGIAISSRTINRRLQGNRVA